MSTIIRTSPQVVATTAAPVAVVGAAPVVVAEPAVAGIPIARTRTTATRTETHTVATPVTTYEQRTTYKPVTNYVRQDYTVPRQSTVLSQVQTPVTDIYEAPIVRHWHPHDVQGPYRKVGEARPSGVVGSLPIQGVYTTVSPTRIYTVPSPTNYTTPTYSGGPIATPVTPIRQARPSARVRFVYNVAYGPDVNIIIDGKVAASGVVYGQVTKYLLLSPDTNNIKVTDYRTAAVLLNVNITVNVNDYTFIIHGSMLERGKPISGLLLKDDHSCPSFNRSKVRFIHAAADAPPVDLFVDGRKVYNDVSYGEIGKPSYVQVYAGAHTLALHVYNKENAVVWGPHKVEFRAGKVYSVIASGVPGDVKYPLAALLELDNQGLCYVK